MRLKFSVKFTLCSLGQITEFTDTPETSVDAGELGVKQRRLTHPVGTFPSMSCENKELSDKTY